MCKLTLTDLPPFRHWLPSLLLAHTILSRFRHIRLVTWIFTSTTLPRCHCCSDCITTETSTRFSNRVRSCSWRRWCRSLPLRCRCDSSEGWSQRTDADCASTAGRRPWTLASTAQAEEEKVYECGWRGGTGRRPELES
jgi:hypothetical protein